MRVMPRALCSIFFASGASALIFETLWFHQAGLALGNSIWASSLVLAGFMGGLALGNALAARLGHRLGDPVRAYAIAEAAIALTGVGLVYLLPELGRLLAPLMRPLLDTPWLLNPLRLGLALILLLVPSTAMGVTLPLLTKALTRDAGFGTALGRLYGWNTLGALVGVVGTETWLLGALGMRGSALAAGALNLSAAGVAAWLARQRAFASLAPAQLPALHWRQAGAPLAAACLAGFTLLALEVVWFRFLSLFVLSHAVSFALILGAVLAGIALGGLAAAAWLARDAGAYRFAPLVAWTTGGLCVVCYAAFPLVLGPFLADAFPRSLRIVALGAPLVLPACFASGAFFTLLGARLHANLPSEMVATGSLSFANTLGAALGSLAGGFLLLPLLGMERAMLLLALTYGGIGALLLVGSDTPRRARSAGAAVFLASLTLFPLDAMQRYVRTPVERLGGPGDRIVEVREGLAETIVYVASEALGGTAAHRMFTNAYSMSGTAFFGRRYMKLYVYLPVALHPAPRSALLISYGVGVTAKALTDTAELTSIDVVDISQDILETSHIVFPDPTEHPLRDPRVRVHIEDGRYFLQTSAREFDLITGEPPPPDMAGVVNLYTREYFELVHARLAPGGIASYWLPTHALSDRATRSVLRAFCDAFADCSLWNGSGSDLMMVGTRGAEGPMTEARFAAQWRDPAVAPELAALGFERPEQLGALFIGDADYLRELTRNAAAVVDDRPKRITAAPTSQAGLEGLRLELLDTEEARERFRHSAWVARLWPQRLREASLAYFEWQRLLNLYLWGLRNPQESSIGDVYRVLSESDLVAPARWLLGSDSDQQRIVAHAPPEMRSRPDHQLHLGIRRLSERNYAGALPALRAAEAAPPLRRQSLGLQIFALAMDGRVEAAQSLAQSRFQELGESDRTQSFWRWMKQRFGVDPRGVALAGAP
jgi:spermidine synthase